MKILSITGGKGGIGKTTISINLALAMTMVEKKVLLFDADLGLANVDIMLDLKPSRTLGDYLDGAATLDQICVTGPRGIRVIPGSSGLEKMASLPQEEIIKVIEGISSLSTDTDVMIADLAAGISQQNIQFTLASQDIILVVCDEPAAIMDSYAILKIFHQRYARSRFGIIINKADGLQESYSTFTRFQDVCNKFMDVSMHYLGYVPYDDYVVMAARENKPVIESYPFSPASRSYHDLAKSVLSWLEDAQVHGGVQYFYEKLIESDTSKDGMCEA